MGLYYFDYGHGGKDPGATYKGRKEADDVLKVGMKTAAIMRANGHTVDESRTTDKTLSLRQRTNDANKKNYDALVSFHRNAFNRKARGVEVFSFPGSSGSRAMALRMQKELVKIGFVDRGAKTANFHMLRESRALAVLPELGFIDNSADNKIFDDNIDKIAEAIARSLVGNINATKPPAPTKPRNYVMNGDRGNSIIDIKQLQKDLIKVGYGVGSAGADGIFGKGTETAVYNFQREYVGGANGIAGPKTLRILKEVLERKASDKNKDNPDRELFYRVVTESFENRNNAEKYRAELKKAGFDSFIDIYNK